MHTRWDWHLQIARRILKAGGIVLHATEGVWGLACDPFALDATRRLLALKNRPPDKGLVLIGAQADAFADELDKLDAPDREAVVGEWPGPVTWVLPSRRFPVWVTGGRETIAARVPGHPQARALCAAFGGVLISTSANRAGKPPARSRLQARARLGRFPDVDYLLPGEIGDSPGSSAIRTVHGAILRAAG